MIEFNKYQLLEVSLTRDLHHRWTEWYQKVAEALVLFTEGHKTTYMIIGKDTSQSIAYDLSHPINGKFNSTTYLTGIIEVLTPKLATSLVNDDEFYLGRGILINGLITEELTRDLIINWQKEVILSDIEFFKMQSDGYSLYWYNPANPDQAQKQLREFFGDFNDAQQP